MDAEAANEGGTDGLRQPENTRAGESGNRVQVAALTPGSSQPVGTVESVVGGAFVVRDGERIPATAGMPLLAGDAIETGAAGEVEIGLVDGALFRLGFSAAMELTEVRWDPALRDGALRVSVSRGGFWLKTGLVAETNPDGMIVETPVGKLQAWGATVMGLVNPEGVPSHFTLLANDDGSVGLAQFSNEAGYALFTEAGHTISVDGLDSPFDHPLVLSYADLALLYAGIFSQFADAVLVEPAAGDEQVLSQGSQLTEVSLSATEGFGDGPGFSIDGLDFGVLAGGLGDARLAGGIVGDSLFGGDGTAADSSFIVKFPGFGGGAGGFGDDGQAFLASAEVAIKFELPDVGCDGRSLTPGDDDLDLGTGDDTYAGCPVDGGSFGGQDTIHDSGGNDRLLFDLAEPLTIDARRDDNNLVLENLVSADLNDKDRITVVDHFRNFDFTPDSAVDVDTEQIALAGHNLQTGDTVTYGSGGGPAIGGLEDGRVYVVIVVDADTIQLALTELDARVGIAIDLSVPDGGFGDLSHRFSTGRIERFQFQRDTFNDADSIAGTGANDFIVGLDVGEEIEGGSGNDLVYGAGGDDTLLGGAGADRLSGGDGDDHLDGGDGDDFLYGGAGNDILDGGDGNDTAFYGGAQGAVTVDLGRADAQQISADEGMDTLIGIERVIGSYFDDTITGSAAAEFLEGRRGNDTISGEGGDDRILGGLGDDTLDGGDGNDSLSGGDGNDTLTGGGGNDLLDGGFGNDMLDGGDGDDVLHGFDGDDTLVGGAGADILIGLGGSDVLIGGDGDDRLGGGGFPRFEDQSSTDPRTAGGRGSGQPDGDDVLEGGAGNDILYMSGGNDTFDGGTGIDWLVAPATVFAGQEDDAILVSGGGAIAVDLLAGTVDGGTVVNVENVVGSKFDDTIRGDDNANMLLGGGGDDVLAGRGGDDAISGEAGSDTIDGGDGDDVLRGGGGDDLIDGGPGLDLIDFGDAADGVEFALVQSPADTVAVIGGGLGTDTYRNIEGVIGSAFADTLTGSAADDSIFGGDGDDTLVGGDGNDILEGGVGNDSIDGGDGVDLIAFSDAEAGVVFTLVQSAADTVAVIGGGFGTDTYRNIEGVIGSAFGDTLTGSAGDDVLFGGDGDDTLAGDQGDDRLAGGAGDDVIDGGDGNDKISFADATAGVVFTLVQSAADTVALIGGGLGTDTYRNIEGVVGSDFADVLTGSDADDTLEGGFGDDTLDGGAGDDILGGGAGNDVIDGGSGADLLDLSDATAGIVFTVQQGDGNTVVDLTGVGLGIDTYRNIEGVAGSGFDDTLIGSGGNDLLFGQAGDDTLIGGDGGDLLAGGAGDDTLDGGAGLDIASFADAGAVTGVNVVLDGAGNAVVADGRGGIDTLIRIDGVLGTDFDDTLIGNAGVNLLGGGAGDDILRGGAGDDLLLLQSGDDVIDGGAGSDTLLATLASAGVTVDLSLIGAQTVIAGVLTATITEVENVTGSDFDDELTGDGGANVLQGLGGDDRLSGGAGDDILDGGAGVDVVSYAGPGAVIGVAVILDAAGNAVVADGQGGTDTLVGIEGIIGTDFDDTLIGNALDNALTGGGGNDTLTGGLGADSFGFAGALDGIDTITDFSLAEGDKLDLTSVFAGVDTSAGLAGFVELVEQAGDTVLRIDADGGGDGFVDLAILSGVVGLGGADDLEAAGGIVV